MGWICQKCHHDNGSDKPFKCGGCGVVFETRDVTEDSVKKESKKRDSDTTIATFCAFLGCLLGVVPILSQVLNLDSRSTIASKLIQLGIAVVWIGGTYGLGKMRDYAQNSMLQTRTVNYTHGGSEVVFDFKESRGPGYLAVAVVVNGFVLVVSLISWLGQKF